MNKNLLKAAQARIPSVPVLINVVSKRAKQLHSGQPPYVKPLPNEEPEDVALREIGEGKLTLEINFSAMAEEPEEE